tara:strand:- start:452 stop:574 length:123 start_codon:yes stop_codon:yes gene_type:complete
MSVCGEIENVEHEIAQMEIKLEGLKRRLAALKSIGKEKQN